MQQTDVLRFWPSVICVVVCRLANGMFLLYIQRVFDVHSESGLSSKAVIASQAQYDYADCLSVTGWNSAPAGWDMPRKGC